MKTNLIAIIISFNRKDKLKNSIESCLRNGVDKIIVIDNASKEEVIFYLKSINDPRVVVNYNNENIGASAAFSLGLELLPKYCQLNESKVVFLDDDSFIDEKFKNNLPTSNEAFFAARVENLEGKALRMNLPLTYMPSTLYQSCRYLFKRPVPRINHREPCLIESASFVGLVMNANLAYVYRELIPKDFFIYCDDVYFTYSLTKKSVPGYYYPNLRVLHDTNDDRRVASDVTLYYMMKNSIITHAYASPYWWWVIVFPKIISYFFSVLGYKEGRVRKLSALLKGVKDGLVTIMKG